MGELTQKQILLNQLLTDLNLLDREGNEKEIVLIINKVAKLKEIEDEEMVKAEAESNLEPPKEEE